LCAGATIAMLRSIPNIPESQRYSLRHDTNAGNIHVVDAFVQAQYGISMRTMTHVEVASAIVYVYDTITNDKCHPIIAQILPQILKEEETSIMFHKSTAISCFTTIAHTNVTSETIIHMMHILSRVLRTADNSSSVNVGI
jgi:hypothetical protein